VIGASRLAAPLIRAHGGSKTAVLERLCGDPGLHAWCKAALDSRFPGKERRCSAQHCGGAVRYSAVNAFVQFLHIECPFAIDSAFTQRRGFFNGLHRLMR
jgi:hypothetical protein